MLESDRLTVAGALALALLLLIGALVASGLAPLRRFQSLYYVFGGLISGNLTLVTVVVTINQLLLSRELETPGELRSEIESVTDYRREVEDAAGRIAPAQPLGFLEVLVENTREEAQNLGGLSFDGMSEDAHEEIEALVTDLTDHFDATDSLLNETDPNTFDVLSAVLTTNYAKDINRIRRLRSAYGHQFSDAVTESTDRLVDRLRDVDVARQYFKSIYLQEELSTLSRVLIYAGLPAEAIAAIALLLFTASAGTVLPWFGLQIFATVAFVVAFLPLLVLSAFILRTATVTQRTAATIPFTTPEQEHA
ncbi:hypothetical protein [Halegenticoccus soli]|uniref:hypothetical protein n=1 Tax=Halegenticoccus soli TaxID=1985678 RepID=UPI000C6EEFA2|nr:hypothetical protein [Halegenticoccus soli]